MGIHTVLNNYENLALLVRDLKRHNMFQFIKLATLSRELYTCQNKNLSTVERIYLNSSDNLKMKRNEHKK